VTLPRTAFIHLARRRPLRRHLALTKPTMERLQVDAAGATLSFPSQLLASIASPQTASLRDLQIQQEVRDSLSGKSGPKGSSLIEMYREKERQADTRSSPGKSSRFMSQRPPAPLPRSATMRPRPRLQLRLRLRQDNDTTTTTTTATAMPALARPRPPMGTLAAARHACASRPLSALSPRRVMPAHAICAGHRAVAMMSAHALCRALSLWASRVCAPPQPLPWTAMPRALQS
jgi:hypothetical protein